MVDPKVKEFVRNLYPIAKEVCRQMARPGEVIPPVGCLAQAAQETGWNLKPKSGIFFGIKTNPSMSGPSVTVGTWEDGPGGTQRIKDSFLAYHDFASACRGYCEFLQKNARYKKALTQNKGIPERFLFWIRYTVNGSGLETETGYATDRRYYDLCSANVQKILAALEELGIPE